MSSHLLSLIPDQRTVMTLKNFKASISSDTNVLLDLCIKIVNSARLRYQKQQHLKALSLTDFVLLGVS